jgi:sugar-specific transcriptional regulator TrmB
MQNIEENVETLMELGLTNSQAKVYLVLLSLGQSNGKKSANTQK